VDVGSIPTASTILKLAEGEYGKFHKQYDRNIYCYIFRIMDSLLPDELTVLLFLRIKPRRES